jgi:hypothetical protein
MPVYVEGKHSPVLGSMRQNFIDIARNSGIIDESHIGLLARLMGYVFHDGTQLPPHELERWLSMGIIRFSPNGKKYLVLPDDLDIDDMSLELLALWFEGKIRHEWNEKERQSHWFPTEKSLREAEEE